MKWCTSFLKYSEIFFMKAPTFFAYLTQEMVKSELSYFDLKKKKSILYSILTVELDCNVSFGNGFRLQRQNDVDDIIRCFGRERNTMVSAAGDLNWYNYLHCL